MKLLYDRLRIQERATDIAPLLADATVFYNNDALQQVIAGEVDLEELPTLAPPYPKFFVECLMPRFDESRRLGMEIMPSIGVMISALDYPDGLLAQSFHTIDDQPYRWSYEMLLFMENKNTHKIENVGAGNILLDVEGQAMPFATCEGGRPGYANFVWQQDFFTKMPKVEDTERLNVLPQIMIDAALYTVGMLHCRNIGTEVVTPRRSESHKMEQRYGLPMTRYHILKVTGKGSAAGTLIGAPGAGVPKSLHWCRGHFKTYTDDAPLMGKLTGTFYWGAQARGRASRGVVTKDYEVMPS